MDLSPTTIETSYADDRRWEHSKHGDDCQRTITLDVAAFEALDLVITDEMGKKRIASGTPVRENGAVFVPAYDAGAPPVQNAACDGHLHETVMVKGVGAGAHAGASLRWHGVVKADAVPVPEGSAAFDPANGADHILYV